MDRGNAFSQVSGLRSPWEQYQPPLLRYGRHFPAPPALLSGIHDVTDTEVGSAASRAAPSSALLRRVLLPTGQLQRRAPQYPSLEPRATCRGHRGLSKVTSPHEAKCDCTYSQILPFRGILFNTSQLTRIYFKTTLISKETQSQVDSTSPIQLDRYS